MTINKQRFRVTVLSILVISLGIFLYQTLRFINRNDIATQKPVKCQLKVPGDVWFISYADGDDVHASNQNALAASALNNCIDHISVYRKKHLDPEFVRKNKRILDQPRGVGYWLWKPYLISQALKKIPENDILMYIDSGIKIRANLSDLLNNLEQSDIVLVDSVFNIRSYVKRDLLQYLDMDNQSVLDAHQIQGGVVILRNTQYVRQFIDEWLALSENEQLITDIPSVNEYPDFIDHRHDQAILSLLALQNREHITLIPFKDKHKYFYHHRRRSINVMPLAIDGFLVDEENKRSYWEQMIFYGLLIVN